MRSKRYLTLSLALILGTPASGCSDGAVQTKSPDLGPDRAVAPEAGKDGPRAEAGKPDAPLATDLAPDRIKDKAADSPRDGAGDKALDSSKDKGPDLAPDLSPDLLPPGPAHSRCKSPKVLYLSGGKATYSDDTTGATDEYSTVACGISTFDGPQLYYKVALTAGKSYLVTLTPAAGFDPALYAFAAATTCSAGSIDSACKSNASDVQGSGPAGVETITINPTKSEDWVLVVDAYDKKQQGKFTLDLVETDPGAGDTCAKPLTLTFTTSTITQTGDTSKSTDEFSTVTCGLSTLDGPQHYYTVSLTSGKAYKLTLVPDAAFDPALYAVPASTKCSASSIDSACTGAVSDVIGSGAAGVETLTLKPKKSEDWLVVVDSYDPGEKGKYTLTLVESTAALNEVCSTPKIISLTGSSVTVSEDTSLAANEFGTTIKCGTSYDFDGPQLYYRVDLAAAKTYLLSAIPKTSWDLALYAFTDASCTAATVDSQCASMVADEAGNGKQESFHVTTTAATTLYLAVDSYAQSQQGQFDLTVSQFTPGANSACSQASALVFTAGKAAVSADTSKAINQFGASVSCGGASALDGPQLFYKVTLDAAAPYKISLLPQFSAYLYIFPAAACSAATQVESACAGKGKDGDVMGAVGSGFTKVLAFTPQTAGDYIIAVDSSAMAQAGQFTLTVEKGP